jgi:hypothetical protein
MNNHDLAKLNLYFKTKSMKKAIILAVLLMAIMANLTLRAQVIGMRIPDSTVISGNNIDIPVYADNTLTGNNVLSYILQVSFNQTCLQVVSVITAGTISAAFGSPAVNTSVPGQVTIAGAGTAALTGAGKFIYIRFKALQPAGIGVNFTGAQNNFFNEGLPSMTFDNGVISITAPPSISITPNNGIITKGETLQFSVSGGAAPYQWTVTNTTVASISAGGLLTGTQAGFTTVVVADNNGLRDTTNSQIEIRAMRLTIPSNLSQWQGSDIDVPVMTTDLTGLNIFSGSLSVNFNQSILTPVGVVQSGTLLAAFPAPLFNTTTPGVFSVDFAGASSLSGSGTLMYLRFHVSPANVGSTAINFISGLFNEDLTPNFTNGYFTTINLPVLSITPFSGSMIAGQTKQFTLNGGGTPPIVWNVSNPNVASINPSGLMTTIRGGNVMITATDFHGATATSGNWLVYDTQVLMPDTGICPAAGEFYYPILIKALPSGESVQSVQATVAYNSTYLTYLGLESTGTLTQGWTYVTNPTAGQVILAGSGTSSFNTDGIIVKLRFTLKPAFLLGSYAFLNLSSVTLNEGVPNPLVDVNGSLSGVNPNLVPGLSVTPSLNPVFTGNPVTFTATPVNGGPGPLFQWKVNSTSVPGATNSTYTYVPANNDAVQCTLLSNAACITGNQATSNTITMVVGSVPANLSVSGNVASQQNKCYSATNTITVAGSPSTYTVQAGSSVTMIAGQHIYFLPGSRVFSGGYLHGYIAPSGPYCAGPPLAPLVAGVESQQYSDPSLFKVFPNPTSGEFTIAFNRENVPGMKSVMVYGMKGEKIVSTEIEGEMNHTFSLASRPAGIYFILVISGSQVETKKIIRQ